MSGKLSEREEEALALIYVGSNVRQEGILKQDAFDYSEEAQSFISKGLAEEGRFYRFEVLLPTPVGQGVAGKLLEARILTHEKEIFEILEEPPTRLTSYLLQQVFVPGLSPYRARSHPVLNPSMWRYRCNLGQGLHACLLDNTQVFYWRTRILVKLEELGLVYRARSYVATKGGRIDPPEFCLPPELVKFLIKYVTDHAPWFFPKDIETGLRIFHLLGFFHSPGTIEVAAILTWEGEYGLTIRAGDELLKELISRNVVQKKDYQISVVDQGRLDGISLEKLESAVSYLLEDKPEPPLRRDEASQTPEVETQNLPGNEKSTDDSITSISPDSRGLSRQDMTSSKSVLLGYEVRTGDDVLINLDNMLVAGLPQQSGKTTTIEALISRGNFRAIVLKSKRGEIEFKSAKLIAPVFFPEYDEEGNIHWRFVEGLLGLPMAETVKPERVWLITACRGAKTLEDVLAKVRGMKDDEEYKRDAKHLLLLEAYLKEILPKLRKYNLSSKLELGPGISEMNLSEIHQDSIKDLIISSVLRHVRERCDNTVVVIPEAYKFLPQQRSNIAKFPAEELAKEGPIKGNFLWLDSQAIAPVDAQVRHVIGNWLIGKMKSPLEIKRALDVLPVPKPKAADIQMLQKGFFYFCTETGVVKCYVQPSWLNDNPEKAREIAKMAP